MIIRDEELTEYKKIFIHNRKVEANAANISKTVARVGVTPAGDPLQRSVLHWQIFPSSPT